MTKPIERNQIILNLIWKFLERVGTQGISFLVAVILARVLLPEDFGIIVIITIFITIANVLVQSGLGTALIQKKEADNLDFSSVFFTSLFLSFCLYTILFFTAPAISTFFNEPELVEVFRVLALVLIPFSLNSIQQVYVIKHMQLKKLFVSGLYSAIISGAVGIYMAINGYGVWALVAQQLSSSIVATVSLWILIEWKPQLSFSLKRLQKLFSFGWKLLVANLLNNLYNEMFNVVVGKKFLTETLGLYNRGKQFPSLIVTNIDNSVQAIMLSAYSNYQDDKVRVKQMMRRSIVTSAFVVFPMMAFLAAAAEPIITIVLTDKWIESVPFLQIFCLFFALQPIQTANIQAINALGRSDIFLKLEILKKTLGIIIILVASNYGIYSIAWSAVIVAVISSFINAIPNKKILNYGFEEQFKDISPAILLSFLLGSIVYSLNFIVAPIWLTIMYQLIFGFSVYLFSAFFFKVESFMYLLNIFKAKLIK